MYLSCPIPSHGTLGWTLRTAWDVPMVSHAFPWYIGMGWTLRTASEMYLYGFPMVQWTQDFLGCTYGVLSLPIVQWDGMDTQDCLGCTCTYGVPSLPMVQ